MDSMVSRGVEEDPERQTVEQIKRARFISGKDANDLVTTKHHVVSLYEPRTPVAVSESLCSPGAKDGATISASGESELAWYVYQRKLLIWRFQPRTEEKSTSCSKATELLLPKSDLPHHAQLVAVFRARGSANSSVIAVSPEGVVRFWDVISPHSSWVDVNANLGGEEVCSVHNIPPYGCVAITTSASLVLIRPTTVHNSPSVVVKHMTGQQGWLSGIGRRVSTIIFGAGAEAQGVEPADKVVRMVTVPGVRRGVVEWQLFLLVGTKLQLRVLRDEAPATLQYEVDLEDLIRKQFAGRVGGETELVVLDVRMSEGGLAVLVASSDPRRYLLLELPCRDENAPPTSAFVLCDLCKRDVDVLERNSGRIPQLQFLLLPTTALFFNRRTVVGVPLDGGSQGRGDVLSIPGEGSILGGLIHKSLPAFFNPTYGFVVVQPVEGACYELLNNARQEPSRLLPGHNYTASIKTAFFMYVRQNLKQCHYVIDKEFPSSTVVDSPLSLALLRFSLDIVHNAPNNDPRWEHFTPGPKLADVVSLFIETQLEEKLKAHDMFLDFVHDSLRTRVGQVTKNGRKVGLLNVIVEHNDKLTAAWKLCKLQEAHGPRIDSAIYKSLEVLNLPTTHQNLTPKDIFYRYVSIVDVGLKCLIEECAEICSSDEALFKKKQSLLSTLAIVRDVAVAVVNKQRGRNFELAGAQDWLARHTGPKAPYEYFKLLFETVAALTSRVSRDEEEELYNQLVASTRDLVDVILHLQSTTSPPERYKALRSWYVSYFVELGEHLVAKQLALKFGDMKALVELTYVLEETDNLLSYVEQYGESGFCEELFRFLLDNGRKAELLRLELPPKYAARLEASLEAHPDVFWLNRLREGDVAGACRALASYAASYAQDVNKSERMWSAVKLLAASEGLTDLDEVVERHLNCIDAQRYLADYLDNLRSSKFVRAYSEVEIVEMLCSPDNGQVSEFHLKKALDLLRFVEDEPTRERLRAAVWSRAVRLELDDLSALKVDSSPEEFGGLLVFRLLQLIISLESEPDQFIAPFEGLNVSDDIDTSKRLIYFLRLGHEHILRAFQTNIALE